MEEDIEFLEKEMSLAKRTYEEKLEKSRSSDNLMMKLAWDVAGYEQLLVKAKEFQKDFDSIADDLRLDVGGEVRRLQKLEKNLLLYYKELYTKKRNPASHLLVFMIADELRNTKPYAIPIQFVPIKSITDQQIRLLEIEIEGAMKSIGMIPVGKYIFMLHVRFTLTQVFPKAIIVFTTKPRFDLKRADCINARLLVRTIALENPHMQWDVLKLYII